MKKATNIVELETPANNAGEALLRKSSKSQAEKIDILKLNSEMEDQLAQLEIQNKELLLLKSIAEETANKYIQQYEFAPLGYFTLSRQGVIKDLNLAGAKIFAKDQSEMLNKQFIDFISDDKKKPSAISSKTFLIYAANKNAKSTCQPTRNRLHV
ncbi:MAG: hypothetical protein PHS59_00670 [Paludibacter sp.]|nr:hypothetical protein [Paludibacter sp.]